MSNKINMNSRQTKKNRQINNKNRQPAKKGGQRDRRNRQQIYSTMMDQKNRQPDSLVNMHHMSNKKSQLYNFNTDTNGGFLTYICWGKDAEYSEHQ